MGWFHRKHATPSEAMASPPSGAAPTPVVTETAGFARPSPDSPVEYTIEIRDLPEKEGVEILVAVVNNGEGPVRITGGKISINVDYKSKGIHDLSFPEAGRDGHVTLDQYEIAHGHFFFHKYTDYKKIETRVFLEYEAVDGIRREQISQRIDTRSYRKQDARDGT